mmetsp:Transcript_14749/g.49640  ORF Transcript_14749/g.49640 Transcript_14749/m.49640 type:complete len:230 (+) Transcript_14749:188-877(+)
MKREELRQVVVILVRRGPRREAVRGHRDVHPRKVRRRVAPRGGALVRRAHVEARVERGHLIVQHLAVAEKHREARRRARREVGARGVLDELERVAREEDEAEIDADALGRASEQRHVGAPLELIVRVPLHRAIQQPTAWVRAAGNVGHTASHACVLRSVLPHLPRKVRVHQDAAVIVVTEPIHCTAHGERRERDVQRNSVLIDPQVMPRVLEARSEQQSRATEGALAYG